MTEQELDEIGRAVHDLYSTNADDIAMCTEAFRILHERGLLVPRAEADARVAAAYEQAAQQACPHCLAASKPQVGSLGCDLKERKP